VQNNRHGTMDATAIRAPGFGHRRVAYLEDLAAFTGGSVITPEAGLSLEGVEPHHLGKARRVIVTEDSTTFIEGAGSPDSVAGRLDEITVELERATHEGDIDSLRERRARLSSRLAVLRVGGATDVEAKERLRRTEGSLAATRAAMAEGFVPGGGTALLRAETALDDVDLEGDRAAGVDVVRSVLSDPLHWIASNAGHDGHSVVDQVRAMPEGHGLKVRVTRLSLQNAASVAALMLTTEALVAEEMIARPSSPV